MHAGGFFMQNALMLMTMYPHIFVDIGALSWTPIAGDMLEPFLHEAKRRRLLNRVMFGSDQMGWPEAIALAIDRVNRLDFLTVEEKQDIFYDNAAKFLGLGADEIARHRR
jgi:predicted TIM-barrel fold metal-dependent hydrolase